MRKLSCPLMILIGLYLIGLIHWRSEMGQRIADWVAHRAPRKGSAPFWLGIAFSLGFCPTMAIIFFGALVPFIIQAPGGLLLIPIFGLGTAVPVFIWALALTAGKSLGGKWIRQVRNTDRYVRWAAAAVFLFLGLTDTMLYWLT